MTPDTDLAAYLAALKRGDIINISSPTIYGSTETQVVERLTATQIVTRSARYSRVTGRPIGKRRPYSARFWIIHPTEAAERQAENAAKQARYNMQRTGYSYSQAGVTDLRAFLDDVEIRLRADGEWVEGVE